jgi:hypothetical protein
MTLIVFALTTQSIPAVEPGAMCAHSARIHANLLASYACAKVLLKYFCTRACLFSKKGCLFWFSLQKKKKQPLYVFYTIVTLIYQVGNY